MSPSKKRRCHGICSIRRMPIFSARGEENGKIQLPPDQSSLILTMHLATLEHDSTDAPFRRIPTQRMLIETNRERDRLTIGKSAKIFAKFPLDRLLNAAGFSLVEVLASVVVLSVAALGITAAWRLADQKALAARLDDRAARILREYYELQTFAPDYLFVNRGSSTGEDTDATDIPLSPGTSRSGYLYHPKKHRSDSNIFEYEDQIPYTVSLSADGKTLMLTYQSQFISGAAAVVPKQINVNPRSLSQ